MWISALLLVFIVATAAGLYISMGAGVPPLAGAPAPAGANGCLRALTRSAAVVSPVESLLLQGGVAIYTGWTTCATILNVSIALSVAGVQDDALGSASTFVCAAAAALAALAAATRTDFCFAGTVCWALSAIHINQTRQGAPQGAIDASLICAGVAGAMAGAAAVWRAGMWWAGSWQLAPQRLSLALGELAAEGKGGKPQPADAGAVVVVANVL